MIAFPTTDDQELQPIVQRLRVIEGLVQRLRVIEGHFNAQGTPSATREELVRMKEQQDVWMQELQMINAQLCQMERDRMMQVSMARLERGVSLMGVRR